MRADAQAPDVRRGLLVHRGGSAASRPEAWHPRTGKAGSGAAAPPAQPTHCGRCGTAGGVHPGRGRCPAQPGCGQTAHYAGMLGSGPLTSRYRQSAMSGAHCRRSARLPGRSSGSSMPRPNGGSGLVAAGLPLNLPALQYAICPAWLTGSQGLALGRRRGQDVRGVLIQPAACDGQPCRAGRRRRL